MATDANTKARKELLTKDLVTDDPSSKENSKDTSNEKSKPVEVSPELAAKILKQMEYYFSDSNLPRDRFLRAKIEETPGGFVPISLFQSFNRIKSFDVSNAVIAEVLKGSELLELGDGGDTVKRKGEMPEGLSNWRYRTLHVRGWPVDGVEPETEKVEGLFDKFGKILSVKMRRWQEDSKFVEGKQRKHFKGSLFVEYDSAEAVEKAIKNKFRIGMVVKDEEGKEKEKEEERELEVQSVDKWKKEKHEEYKKKREKKRAQLANEGDEQMITVLANKDAKKGKAEFGEEGKKEFVKGLILKFDGIGPEVSREDIKDILGAYGLIAFVQFDRGDAEGYVRFSVADAAEKVVDAFKSKSLMLGGKVPEGYVLKGEEEEKYWKDVWERQDSRKHGLKRSYPGKNKWGSKGKKKRRFRADSRARDGKSRNNDVDEGGEPVNPSTGKVVKDAPDAGKTDPPTKPALAKGDTKMEVTPTAATANGQ